MSGPILWKAPSGTSIINLATVSSVSIHNDGDLAVYAIGDGGSSTTVRKGDAKSFLAALDAAFAPTLIEQRPPDVDAVIEHLDRLRHDMATVGGNALVEAVRDLAIAIRGVGRG